MSKPGRKSIEVNPNVRNKMITLRINGELYNQLSRLSNTQNISLNKICIDAITGFLLTIPTEDNQNESRTKVSM